MSGDTDYGGGSSDGCRPQHPSSQGPCIPPIHVTCTTPCPPWWLVVLQVIGKFITWWIANPAITVVLILIALPIYFVPKATGAIEECAAEGPLHEEDYAGYAKDHNWTGRGPHPEGWCKNVKLIVLQSIPIKRIAREVCEECKEGSPPSPRPLVLGDSDIRLRRSGRNDCGQFDWTIDYKLPNDRDFGATVGSDYLYQPERAQSRGQISLPQFCVSGSDRRWIMLQPPRVYYTASSYATGDDNMAIDEKRAPYVLFVAMEEASPHIANAYFIYLDDRSERPQVVEISFESLRNKPLIGPGRNLQLISNLKLDSDLREITFQIGALVTEMTIAGVDFGPCPIGRPNCPRVGRQRTSDASGSYVVSLNQNGAVDAVNRLN